MAAYGSSEFPAFFSPRSGCRAPSRVDSPEEAAALMEASRQLGIDSGIVIGRVLCRVHVQNLYLGFVVKI